MSDGNPLINLGDISKPVTLLIEKVSNAIGVLYEPQRIRKQAEAEAEAEKIKALASIELNEIQQRAVDRFVDTGTEKRENPETLQRRCPSSEDPPQPA